MFKKIWQQRFFALGIFGGIQFLILTTVAMWVYPGGTVHEPNLESYSFLYNFFSDLGRTRTFAGESNLWAHLIFKMTLSVSAVSMIFFFIALPSVFTRGAARVLILGAVVFGILASLCYIGIAFVPWNESYWGHVYYVRNGFIAFLVMTLFYTMAIVTDSAYPNKYAGAFGIFGIILAIQIVIMLFGPRAYRSNDALFLQASIQKVIVYAEILCMLYQSYGALRLSREREIQEMKSVNF